MPSDDYLTPNQVAELLKVSPVTVRHWALEGKLQFDTTPGGHRRFAPDVIARFAHEHGVAMREDKSKGQRILIVDDNVELAVYLSELVTTQQPNIIAEIAHDGFEAGEKLHSFNPTIVLLDLMMPGLNGFDTCQRIKQNPLTKHIHVIAMTGFPSDQNIERILEAGAETCLSKPIRAPKLLNALGIDVTNKSNMK